MKEDSSKSSLQSSNYPPEDSESFSWSGFSVVNMTSLPISSLFSYTMEISLLVKVRSTWVKDLSCSVLRLDINGRRISLLTSINSSLE